MEWLLYVIASIFSLLGLGCIYTVILGLPGTWIMIGLAVVIEFTDQFYLPNHDAQTFPWWLLIVTIALAGLGELLEFVAGMLGAKQAGSTKRGMVGALIGGIAGGILGIAIPIPIFGSLIGAIIGTFVGALLGEMSGPELKSTRESIKPATGATIGRILGTLSKLPVAVLVWFMLTVSAFWP